MNQKPSRPQIHPATSGVTKDVSRLVEILIKEEVPDALDEITSETNDPYEQRNALVKICIKYNIDWHTEQ